MIPWRKTFCCVALWAATLVFVCGVVSYHQGAMVFQLSNYTVSRMKTFIVNHSSTVTLTYAGTVNNSDILYTEVTASPLMSKTSESQQSSRSFLLALSYSEQLSAATKSLFQLAPLAADWNAQLVEPVVAKSHLFGIRGLVPSYFKSARDEISFSQLYSLEKINDILHRRVAANLSMVSQEEFIATAPQSITLLFFDINESPSRSFSLSKHLASIYHGKSRSTDDIIDCTTMLGASNIAQQLRKRLSSLSSHNRSFVVVKSLCLKRSTVYSSRMLFQHVSHPGTIVFASWRGCGFANCSVHFDRRNSKLSAFRFGILTENTFTQSLSLGQFHLLQNEDVKRTAQLYLKKLGIKKPFLSIHLRTERLIKHGIWMKVPSNWKCCLDNLKAILKTLTDKFPPQQTLVITDYSSYGTDGCRTGVLCKPEMVRAVISRVKSFNLTIASYQPKSGSIWNSGFVSLVEMNMLSLGAELVLAGGGGFQAILKSAFLSLNHTETDVHSICVSTEHACMPLHV